MPEVKSPWYYGLGAGLSTRHGRGYPAHTAGEYIDTPKAALRAVRIAIAAAGLRPFPALSRPRSEDSSVNPIRRCLVLSAASLFVACSTSPSRVAAGDTRDQTRLTAADIQAADPNLTLYELISRVRPQWLSRRPGTQLQGQLDVVVYRDDIRAGESEALREIRLDIVSQVRYLTGPEATGRYGLNHPHGAIVVTTRR